MRRRVNGTDALDTINAAATAITYVDNRTPQSPSQKRWGSCWSMYWCFGLNKNKRIGHAVLIPEPNTTTEHPSHPLSTALPFFAPPSSPASFLPSEPPSATQSPSSLISFTSASRNMYSPSGLLSIFALGPYAHETQLVSPPVFSTFTTEPSTAPFTPPPESIHLTTPSSPEVPFARFLEPNLQSDDACQRLPLPQYDSQLYQLQPGSPASHLISPRSGTSSPFPDCEIAAGHPLFYEFRTSNSAKHLALDKIVLHECDSGQGSGSMTPDAMRPGSCNTRLLNPQNSGGVLLEFPNDESTDDHRVSFELTDEVKKAVVVPESSPELVEKIKDIEEGKSIKTASASDCSVGETSSNLHGENKTNDEKELRHHKKRTVTLGSSREFNFGNVDCGKSIDSSEWWVNEKDHAEGGSGCKNWAFFPMMQSGS